MDWRAARTYVRAMSIRTIALALLLALSAAAAAPALAHIVAVPAGPPPPSGLPGCEVGDVPAPRAGYDEWAETLLDTERRLATDYVPPDLLAADLPGGKVLLRVFVIRELEAMLAAAEADGVSIAVTSGYRSHSRQAAVYQQMVEERGDAYARLSAARPGHSEHQLGTTVDLSGGAAWLAEHAWQFGFLMSYPPGRSPAWTCYKPEPWHYRYFGRRRAAEMRDSGLSPREWLWQRQASPE
jgi:zinc D-Ala-D-Ala carboxypeptidase